MNILYGGRYLERFNDLFSLIDKNVKVITELCFGDLILAGLCKKNGVKWRGVDVNGTFVKRARALGFDAEEGNLLNGFSIPKADVCIMMGSLYHFHGHEEKILKQMVASSIEVIISEPIKNITSSGGILGFFGKIGSATGSGETHFRFNEISLIEMLEKYSKIIGYKYSVLSKKRDLTVRITHDSN